MAKAKITLPLTSSLGDYSLYKMHGVDKMILRQKGGVSKHQYNTLPKYEVIRQNGKEFGGASRMASGIKAAMIYVDRLADYNYISSLVTLAKHLQTNDKVHARGFRSLLLSGQPGIIKGFSLNKKNCFDSVVSSSPLFSIDREKVVATVQFPELLPGLNLQNPKDLPMFKLIISLGVVDDLVRGAKQYKTINDNSGYCRNLKATPWHSYSKSLPATMLRVDLQNELHSLEDFNDHCTLVLAVGIEFGVMDRNGIVTGVKYAGSAKVLEVG